MNMTTREQFLAERRRGIGGSDVAAILGMSKWKSALDVYLDKRGEAPEQPDNESMLWGRALEPVIRQQYAERTGRVVLVPTAPVVHPVHTFARANLDGVTEGGRLVEIKTARTAQDWGEPGTDEVPDAYALQVQHYLMVTRYEVADVAVLIGGSDFRLYEVRADAELQAMLIEREAAFWDCVQRSEPPAVTSFADAQRRWGRSARAGSIEADAEAVAAAKELQALRVQVDGLTERIDACKATITRALADRGDTLVADGKTIATWKLAKAPARFDAKAFEVAHPDLYQQFIKPGEPSRRLLLK
ncbi:MAG: YqaJ viral recombinase family protein [Rudaea sp.]|uniref:YqaJ viral recombinase family nuclease n=1 Tax=Rudaea sp. TaxID=2136325 RepID=UPI0039E401CC